MKALSVHQPWAWLIVNGYKDIENRTRKTNYRGPLLIHASKTVDNDAVRMLLDTGVQLPSRAGAVGGVVGIVELVDCVKEHDSEWFGGPWGWVLQKPLQLEIVPMRGQLGLFEVNLQGSVIAFSLHLWRQMYGVEKL